jgi:thiamine pyrophosphokinase
LVILNRPLANVEALATIWENTVYRVCADGGANRLYDVLSSEIDSKSSTFVSAGNFNCPLPAASLNEIQLPDMIVGDLDSLRDDVKAFYLGSGHTGILEDGDKYSTDFGKSIKLLASQTAEKDTGNDVLILGSLSGRVDQGLGILHELYREAKSHPEWQLWLISEASISFLLRPGSTRIEGLKAVGDNEEPVFTPNVGVLPIFGPARISTHGLEWDVIDWATEMGKNVSTSNHVVESEIQIQTDAWVLFTVERYSKEER